MAQKSKPWVDAKSSQTCTGQQIAWIRAAPYRADVENVRRFAATNRRGTVFAQNEYLYQKQAIRKERPNM